MSAAVAILAVLAAGLSAELFALGRLAYWRGKLVEALDEKVAAQNGVIAAQDALIDALGGAAGESEQ